MYSNKLLWEHFCKKHIAFLTICKATNQHGFKILDKSIPDRPPQLFPANRNQERIVYDDDCYGSEIFTATGILKNTITIKYSKIYEFRDWYL